MRNARYARPDNWRAGAKAVYRRLSRSGVFISRDELVLCSLYPEQMLKLSLDRFQPRSVLDVGCGTGRSLDFFLECGVDALGVDASRLARRHSRHPDKIVVHDLRKPLSLDQTFDMVWCFEVAEHIHPLFTEIFLRTLASHAPLVIMSAAPPGQGGEGHFNEQPREYWIERAARFNLSFDDSATREFAATGEFYSENVMVFRRGWPGL